MSYTVYALCATPLHRDTRIDAVVDFDCGDSFYGNIEVIVVKTIDDQKWWITPNDYGHEKQLEDVGPFDTVEDAIFMLRLTATRLDG